MHPEMAEYQREMKNKPEPEGLLFSFDGSALVEFHGK